MPRSLFAWGIFFEFIHKSCFYKRTFPISSEIKGSISPLVFPMPVRRRIPKESENRIPKSIEERHTGESLEISSRFCHIFPMAPLAAKNALPPKIES